MMRFGMAEDEIIESNMVSKTIERAQEKVEKHNFEIRKHLLEYDDVLNQQRMAVYGYRRNILEGEDQIYDLIRDLVLGAIRDLISWHSPKRSLTIEQAHAVFADLSKITGFPVDVFKSAKISTANSDLFEKDLSNYILEQYSLYRNQQNVETVHQAEKWLMLETIDQAWKQHMLNLDNLKEGIGLRGWGQKNPLVEYKREAFAMFQDMMNSVRQDIVRHIFHLNLERFNAHELEVKRERELEQLNMISSDTVDSKGQQQQVAADKVGRNDPCPCGSGKKYKKCHGLGK
jgi:preprotein translocase subunit SecA